MLGQQQRWAIGERRTDLHARRCDRLTSVVASIGQGYSHICAVTTEGDAKCWGYNASGQLGDGGTTNRLTPVDVQP